MKAIANFCEKNSHYCKTIGDTSALIRIRHSHGYYLLEPLEADSSRVTWVQHTDPGGDLPNWIVNYMIQDMPYKTLRGLRKKVFEEKYQRTRLIISPENKIISFQNN